jgi:GMP synthase-like glutamine amidotransferase
MVRIAVLTMPASRRSAKSYISAATVRWLRGIEVVPIVVGTDLNEAAAQLRSCHGLYMGGGPTYEPAYFQLANHMLTIAIHLNRQGHYFTVWGVCHGFQMLVALLGRVWPLEPMDAMRHTEGHLKKYSHCRLLASATPTQRANLFTKGTPFFSHRYGISLKRFLANEALTATFRICTTSCDRSGKEYVSMIEAYDLPFYGLQFHPEYGLPWMAAFLKAELLKRGRVAAAPKVALPSLSPCPAAWSRYGMEGMCYEFS